METIKGVLCDWEENGYDDSDGYIAYWDDAEKTVKKYGHWTTRFGSGPAIQFIPCTKDEAKLARAWLAEKIYNTLRYAEHKDVLEPQSVSKGSEVKFIKAHKFDNKKTGEIVIGAEGDCGRIFWVGNFGTFYRNGYNKPGRGNCRVGVELTNGKRLFAPLEKLRLAREPMADDELRKRAENLSYEHQYGKMLSMRHAWDSINYAKQVLPNKASE
jgi:hypothetical protein